MISKVTDEELFDAATEKARQYLAKASGKVTPDMVDAAHMAVQEAGWYLPFSAIRAALESALQQAPAGEGEAAREAFLDMMADANKWLTETDEGGTQHTIITGDDQLRSLAKALGIPMTWREPTEDAIFRAIEAGPQPAAPLPAQEGSR